MSESETARLRQRGLRKRSARGRRRRHSAGRQFKGAASQKTEAKLLIRSVASVVHSHMLAGSQVSASGCYSRYLLSRTDSLTSRCTNQNNARSSHLPHPFDVFNEVDINFTPHPAVRKDYKRSPAITRRALTITASNRVSGTQPVRSPAQVALIACVLAHTAPAASWREPSVQEVAQYIGYVSSRAQLDSECVVVMLVYLERILEATKGRLLPRPRNWRSLLLSCVMLASKVWDDMSMCNGEFCAISGRVTLGSVCEMEIVLLETLHYNVRVNAATYGKLCLIQREVAATPWEACPTPRACVSTA